LSTLRLSAVAVLTVTALWSRIHFICREKCNTFSVLSYIFLEAQRMKEPRRNQSENIHKEVAKADIFAELYEQYMPRVFGYVYYKVNNVHLAEDLTSSVFEKAITRFRSYRSDKASFSTWLFAIARNTMIDHFRTSTRGELVPLEDTDITSK